MPDLIYLVLELSPMTVNDKSQSYLILSKFTYF